MPQPEISPYWRRTRRLTGSLLLVWYVLTFGVVFFARELNEFNWLGFPLGFYFAAQGVFFCYLGIVVYYNRRMQSLDAVHTVPSGQGGE
ncbi:DUF4212 domain-containing protein [Azonexus hydrophilus]|uniref:DUF4212 domain-containing protein n=1 Tax=Azonexus hydrophilus TaxID=418702 RepID=UPI001966BD24|nr:DUF4212 domain-containing protein [Azonexus hydrophilus]